MNRTLVLKLAYPLLVVLGISLRMMQLAFRSSQLLCNGDLAIWPGGGVLDRPFATYLGCSRRRTGERVPRGFTPATTRQAFETRRVGHLNDPTIHLRCHVGER